MKISKDQLVDGITNYIKNEVLNNIPDNSTKIIIGTAIYSIRRNNNLLEQYIFNNPIFKSMYYEDDGYDIGLLIEGLRYSMEEYGNITFNIPAIPLISKESKTLSFSSYDLDIIKRYLERSVSQ